jgi:hypothetical protein
MSQGRITLSENTLIVTRDGKREERSLKEEERDAALKKYFGVSL